MSDEPKRATTTGAPPELHAPHETYWRGQTGSRVVEVRSWGEGEVAVSVDRDGEHLATLALDPHMAERVSYALFAFVCDLPPSRDVRLRSEEVRQLRRERNMWESRCMALIDRLDLHEPACSGKCDCAARFLDPVTPIEEVDEAIREAGGDPEIIRAEGEAFMRSLLRDKETTDDT